MSEGSVVANHEVCVDSTNYIVGTVMVTVDKGMELTGDRILNIVDYSWRKGVERCKFVEKIVVKDDIIGVWFEDDEEGKDEASNRFTMNDIM